MSDCVNCKCEPIPPGDDNCQSLQQENDIKIGEFASMVKLQQLCYLPIETSKGFYNVWCVLKSVIAQICYLTNKSDCKVNELLEIRNTDCAREASNMTKLSTYLTQSSMYQQEITNSINNLSTTGYLNKLVSQPLIFKEEGDTFITASETQITYTAFLAYVRQKYNQTNDTLGASIGQQGNGLYFVLQPNVPLRVSYALNNSSYAGTKLSKVIYEYTNKGDSAIPLTVFKSPNGTFKLGSADPTKDFSLGISVSFYNEQGVKVAVPNSVVAFNSLNSAGEGSYEGIDNFDGEFVLINGSTIETVATRAYSRVDNSIDNSWDNPTSNNFYIGSIAGVTRGDDINFDLVLHNKLWLWFSFNTEVASKSVPEAPSVPVLDNTCAKIDEIVCG